MSGVTSIERSSPVGLMGLINVLGGRFEIDAYGSLWEAVLQRKFDLRPEARVPRFGESIDRQKTENGTLAPRF